MVLGIDGRVLTLGIARMADALGNSFLIIVLPLYIERGPIDVDAFLGAGPLGIDVTVGLLVGIVLSLFGLLNSLGQPFTGRLSDRTGARKRYILVGLVVFGVASAAYPFVTSYPAVVVVRALQGIGAAFTVPVTVALVNEYADSDTDRGGNFGLFNTFRLIGFGGGPLVAAAVVDRGPYPTPLGALSGFDAAFGVAVLGAVISFALVTLFIADPEDTEASAGEDLSFRVTDPEGGLDPVFVLGVGTFFMATTIALFATLQTTVRAALDEGSLWFGAQFAAVVVANVVFQVPVGRYSDRIGRRPLILAGFALLVPSVLVQGYVPGLAALVGGDLAGPLAMLLLRGLQGVAVALVFAPGLALAGDLAGAGESGSTLSVLTMAFGLGVAAGPLVAGFLIRYGFAAPFTFGAALGLAGLVLTWAEVEETITPGTAPAPQD
jgi:MFS family permease